MRQHLDEGYTSLPLILNICLYNGPTPYQGPITLLELFEHPELAKNYLLTGYHLVDLRRDTVERIRKDKKAALAELLLKQGGVSHNFHEWLDAYESLLSDLASVYNEEVYLYIFTIDSRRSTLERIDQIKDPTQRRVAMTIAQQCKTRRYACQGVGYS